MSIKKGNRGVFGIVLGLVAVVALAGFRLAAASNDAESTVVAGETSGDDYCNQYPQECSPNITTPVVTTPGWYQRFEDAGGTDRAPAVTASGWTDEDAARLEAGFEALACLEAMPGATTQEEADQLLQAQTVAAVQPVLEEYWAPSARETEAQAWFQGKSMYAAIGRQAPVGCRLNNFRVRDVRSDSQGLIVHVRYQTEKRFLDPANGAYAGADGWELSNPALEYSSIVELERDAEGRIIVLSDNFFRDPNEGDSGI